MVAAAPGDLTATLQRGATDGSASVLWMRTPLLALILAALAVAVAAPAAPAATSWCSESGDTCYGTFKRDGKRYVSVTYAARYKTKERLCVKAPGGQRDCVTRRLKQGAGDTWALTLRWSTSFPNRGPGVYTLESPSPEPITFRIR
jgi:hypothetical protein